MRTCCAPRIAQIPVISNATTRGFSSIPSRKKTQETFFDFATTLPVDKPTTIRIYPRLKERIAGSIHRKDPLHSLFYARDTREIRSTGKPECFQARSGRHLAAPD